MAVFAGDWVVVEAEEEKFFDGRTGFTIGGFVQGLVQFTGGIFYAEEVVSDFAAR